MIQTFIDRGMSKAECKTICTSSIIPIEQKLFFRCLYELSFRPMEVQHLKIENWNKNTGEITAQKTKVKYNPKTKEKTQLPRSMILSKNTNELMKIHVSQRKKGYIFISSVTGNPKTLRFFEKELDKYARILSIQKKKNETIKGKIYSLVTLMALREAGERHHDEEGGDETVSARASGHSIAIKHKYYKKVSYEEAQESYKKNHPAFKEEW